MPAQNWKPRCPQRTAQDITERKRTEDALRSIVEGTASETGAEFFRALVRRLASVLGARYALVGELLPGEPKQVRTLAMWAGDDFGEKFDYSLEGTPCESA